MRCFSASHRCLTSNFEDTRIGAHKQTSNQMNISIFKWAGNQSVNHVSMKRRCGESKNNNIDYDELMIFDWRSLLPFAFARRLICISLTVHRSFAPIRMSCPLLIVRLVWCPMHWKDNAEIECPAVSSKTTNGGHFETKRRRKEKTVEFQDESI